MWRGKFGSRLPADREKPMKAYRCHFLDRDNQLRSTEEVEAEGLAEAIDRSLTMLRLRPHHHAIELWQGARLVYPSLAPTP
jgi:hypothetical protein